MLRPVWLGWGQHDVWPCIGGVDARMAALPGKMPVVLHGRGWAKVGQQDAARKLLRVWWAMALVCGFDGLVVSKIEGGTTSNVRVQRTL